ncbi:MAG TPA: DUF2309 domain-containing protein [Candidatus Binatia bacterium]|nr:DUF2309 domain-containing protein [Candidatus Binatia bacterium]
MAEVAARQYSESRRMELRGLIRLASETIAYYWPMRTFVHHNPLHGLEDLHFNDAVSRARQLLGGQGYLSGEIFRDYFTSGRILPRHLDRAIGMRAQNDHIELAGRKVSLLDVRRAQLIHGLFVPSPDVIDVQLQRHPDRQIISALADHLFASLKKSPMASPGAPDQQGRDGIELLAAWCDRTLGAQIIDQINREMIKWCEAFLDEGHATWPMPNRELGFYPAWKLLAQSEWSPCGIPNNRGKLARLPALAEDALLESLELLVVEPAAWQDYLALHLAALPGWAGAIKWRADQDEYEWQRAYPVDLVQYLAVRLWYERELVQKVCHKSLGADGNMKTVGAQAQQRKNLPLDPAGRAEADKQKTMISSWRLIALARRLEMDPARLCHANPENLWSVLAWLDGFPESSHGGVWLKAFEAGYEEQLVDKLRLNHDRQAELHLDDPSQSDAEAAPHPSLTVRPQAQAVFCIDVRSEPFRRQLEAIGDYETFGFAGFFAVFIRHQALGSHHETDQFPVITKGKNLVREIPRTYQGRFLYRHRHRAKLLDAGHALLYDLKENVVTPYVMVESLGWFYSLPFIGKTLCPAGYRTVMEWLRRKLVPSVATTLTVDKLSRAEVEEMIAAEQRAMTRQALQEKFGDRHLNLSLERLEFLRRRALDEASAGEPSSQARSTALSAEEEAAFVEELRQHYGINQGGSFARMERITRTGFTLAEQVFTVETALRMMGLTKNFARLVLLCGHGSHSENNPFEAALDCGACGGNAGKPNARVLAIMANRPLVREQLATNGIAIPQDSYFIAGQHNTTTDDVELFDLEDLPPTHRKDLLQLVSDLEKAGARSSQERCARLPEINVRLDLPKAKREARRRSIDWSQVRPEWGLSRNAAFIIGRRALTHGIDLDGRVFLHSYDFREDRDGRLLEGVMTGPQVVAQWINMEHYFSTVDQEVYGSGSKIYHNVAGRLAVMSGPQSDLRTGLAWQTVMNGERPYHEAMRLLTVIEAPRERVDGIIRNQSLLRRLYDNEWLRLIVVDPEGRKFYRYLPKRGWKAADLEWLSGDIRCPQKEGDHE